MVIQPKEAIQMKLGDGQVLISVVHSDAEGLHGLLFEDTGIQHDIGSYSDDTGDHKHMPLPGEIYLFCKNKESAIVLREQIDELIKEFERGI